MMDRFKSYLPFSLRSGPDTAVFLALAGAVVSVMFSIWVAERFLEATILAVIWRIIRDRQFHLPRVPFLLPLSVFFAWTLVASLVAGENPINRHTLGKFYILIILFIVPIAIRGAGQALWIYRALFAAAGVVSAAGLAQFVADPHRGLMDRITGFMSTWMNYSGQLMLVLVALAAYVLCYGFGKRGWLLILGLLLAAAITLSLTRSAWAGTAVGVGMVVVLRRPRLTPALVVLLLTGYLAAPANIQQRLLTSLNPADPNTANRIELFQTSMRMIRDHPWVGVGPNSVARAALRYRGTSEYLDWMYQHMHNNLLQLAAERGLPGLLIWLWFVGRLAWDAARVYQRSRASLGKNGNPGGVEALAASTAALGAITAFLAMGMFEYNYGSSPVLIVCLFVVGVPYAFLSCEPGKNAAADHADS